MEDLISVFIVVGVVVGVMAVMCGIIAFGGWLDAVLHGHKWGE